MSRNALNLFLLLVVAGLALLVYLQPGKQPVQNDRVRLTPVDVETLTELRLERQGGDTLLFRREGGQWWLSSPHVVAANRFRVEQLLWWFTARSASRYRVAGLALSQYDLEKPRAHLYAGNQMLAFGGHDSLQQRRYVLAGESVYLVSDRDASALFAQWDYFASPKLLPAGRRVMAIVIPGLGKVQRGERGWRYEGDKGPPSADAMQALADRWASAQAVDVEGFELSVKGEELLFRFDNGVPDLRYRVVRSDEGLLLVNPQLKLAYRISDSQVQRLFNWSD